MGKFIKTLFVVIGVLFAIPWGWINVIGNLQTGQQLLDATPKLVQWMGDGSHAGWIILPCLFVFLFEGKITRLLQPIRITFKPQGLIRTRLVNNSEREQRIETVSICSVDSRGKVTEWDRHIHKFYNCNGLPHPMPPKSNCDVEFKLSVGTFYSSGHKRFYARVALEDGTIFRSRSMKVSRFIQAGKIPKEQIPISSNTEADKANDDHKLKAALEKYIQLVDNQKYQPARALQLCGALEFETNGQLIRLLEDMGRYGYGNVFKNQFCAVDKELWLPMLKGLARKGIDGSDDSKFLHEAIEWQLGDSGNRYRQPSTDFNFPVVQREHDGTMRFSRDDLTEFLSAIHRRAQEVADSVMGGLSLNELQQGFEDSIKLHNEVKVHPVPLIDSALINRCMELELNMPWADLVKLSRSCEQLNTKSKDYMRNPAIMKIDSLLRNVNEIHRFTDQEIPAQFDRNIV